MPYKEDFRSEGTTNSAVRAARDAAEQASHDCPFCGGEGLVTIYHPDFTGNAVGRNAENRLIPHTLAAFCQCALGDFFFDQCLVSLRRRIPRLAELSKDDVMESRRRAGEAVWTVIPPDEDETMQYPDRPVDAQSFAALRQRIQRARIGNHFPPNPTRTSAPAIAAALANRKAVPA